MKKSQSKKSAQPAPPAEEPVRVSMGAGKYLFGAYLEEVVLRRGLSHVLYEKANRALQLFGCLTAGGAIDESSTRDEKIDEAQRQAMVDVLAGHAHARLVNTDLTAVLNIAAEAAAEIAVQLATERLSKLEPPGGFRDDAHREKWISAAMRASEKKGKGRRADIRTAIGKQLKKDIEEYLDRMKAKTGPEPGSHINRPPKKPSGKRARMLLVFRYRTEELQPRTESETEAANFLLKRDEFKSILPPSLNVHAAVERLRNLRSAAAFHGLSLDDLRVL